MGVLNEKRCKSSVMNYIFKIYKCYLIVIMFLNIKNCELNMAIPISIWKSFYPLKKSHEILYQ